MKNKVALLMILTLILGVSITSSALAGITDIFMFTLTTPDLSTLDPLTTFTWEATISSANDLYGVFNFNYQYTFLNGQHGTVNILAPTSLTLAAKPDSWTGPFAEFAFDPGQSFQQLQFSVTGQLMGGCWNVETRTQNASATVVPEPSSMLLSLVGFAGLFGYGIKRRKRS